MRKNFSAVILTVMLAVICVLLGSVEVNAETVSGQCGANATWTLDTETGVLTIEGSGKTNLVKGKDWTSYKSAIKSVVISDGITNIFESAFSGYTSLKSVQLGSGITVIDKQAFSSCSRLESITFPDSVTEIKDYAFQNCTSLKSIIIPDSVTMIGFYAFENCKALESCVLSDNITSLYSGLFRGCTSLSNVKLPAKLTSTSRSVFEGCESLKSIVLPEGLQYIAIDSFIDSGLTELVIPASVSFIDNYSVSGCNDLVSLKVAEDSKYYYCVSNCIIHKEYKQLAVVCNTSVVPLDEGIKIIGKAFQGFNKITTVNIPKTVELINESFYGMNLKSMYIYSPVITQELVKGGDYSRLYKATETLVIEKSVHAEGIDTEVYSNVEEIQYYDYTYVIYSKHAHDWQKANGAGFYGEKCSVCEVMRGSDVCKDHTYEPKQDASSHWQECICGEKKNVSTHTWDGGKVTVQPSYSQNGERLYTCTACTQTKTESIPKLVEQETTHVTKTDKTETTTPAETTAPAETTTPAETTAPVETTAPADTTASTDKADTGTEPVTTGIPSADIDTKAETDAATEKKENNTAFTAVIVAAMAVLAGGVAAAVYFINKKK